jgi:hypothetical protein
MHFYRVRENGLRGEHRYRYLIIIYIYAGEPQRGRIVFNRSGVQESGCVRPCLRICVDNLPVDVCVT